MSKVCSCCKQVKPLEKYYNNCTSKDGKGSYCKTCNTEQYRKRRFSEEHRESILEKQRSYNKKRNKEYPAIRRKYAEP